ncbi:MAG: hypothetical protein K2Q26_00945 [Bdellovibrionales bacterium]|nr:hypothetical protein [Bdellovibrionales bacterium]
MMLKILFIGFAFSFFGATTQADDNTISDYAQVIYDCDTSGMLLAKFTHGIIFFEIAYRDDGPPLGRFNIYVKSLDQVKTCEDARRAFDGLLQLWQSVGVDFQKEYIESADGQFQLDRLSKRLKSQLRR